MRTRSTRFVALLAVLALTASACAVTVTSTTDPGTSSPVNGAPGPQPRVVLASNALVTFDACDEFMDYVITHGVDLVGPYGLEDPFFSPWFARGGDSLEFALEDAAATSAPAGSDGAVPSFSETNVQVLGVDEPDIVKTDGERIVVLSDGRLIIADVTDEEPEVLGRLNLGSHSIQNLFLSGDRVLMFGSAWSTFHPLVADADAEFVPTFQTPTLQITEVDISDDPEIVRTMTIDGRFLSGRMIDDTVRLVMQSSPVGFEWSYPKGSGLRAEREAVEENREIIRNSDPENWIPYYIVTDEDGDVTAEGTLFDCESASHPQEFSGLNMLSVLTIDLGEGLEVSNSIGLLANGDTIYASHDSLYVATQNWQTWQWAREGGGDEPEGITTEIHKFDISNLRTARYSASGVIDGYLLNQFAMDEHGGFLRTASTTSPAWWGGGSDSESMVTVLRDDDGQLVEVGRVDGLGETEQIYSVRFMGDIGYVVTFRQTDPLYTIDLSDPEEPLVAGELKILGYSAYLHPLGDGLLMGVGQDATETGRIQGTQVSIFDVSDPSDPTKVDQYTLSEGSNSSAEYDHHAFLYWAETGLAMIPVQQYSWDEKSESAWFGAVGLMVDEEGDVKELERVTHPGGEDDWDWQAQIRRSVVIGDSVYTISSKGIMKSSLDDLAEEAWLDF